MHSHTYVRDWDVLSQYADCSAGATAALRGGAKFSLLSAPKFALRSLAQSLAREFQPQVGSSHLERIKATHLAQSRTSTDLSLLHHQRCEISLCCARAIVPLASKHQSKIVV